MMYQKVIARRYAKGLMLASKPADFDQLATEFNELVRVANAHEELARVFVDPAFLPSDRKAVIDRIAQKAAILPVLHNFLLVLVDKDRLPLLSAIYDEFMRLIDDQVGRIRAHISSASALNTEEIGHITKALATMSHKTVSVQTDVDDQLLGGIRVEMAGMIFDGTVKAKLYAMKSLLLSR